MANKRVFNREIFFKRLEEISGMTKQVALAERLNISTTKISDWHTGKAVPGLHDLLQIADEFQCSIDYLLGLEDNSPVKIYTARDVCRIITELDRQYGIAFHKTDEEPNGTDQNFLYEMYGDNVQATKCTRMWLSVTPHFEDVTEYEEDYDGAPIQVGPDEYSSASREINKYLLKYYGVRQASKIISENAGVDTTGEIYANMLRSVPEYRPPHA